MSPVSALLRRAAARSDVHPECDDCSDPDVWTHLHGGEFRRPTAGELSAVIGSDAAHDWQVVL